MSLRSAPTEIDPDPTETSYAAFALKPEGKEMSTTVAAVRMLSGLLKNKDFGPRIVPVVADEARTFGMDNLFRQVGIYAPQGQLYQPEDAVSMMFYKEAKNGQLLEEGITEAGALAPWTAAGTSYSVQGTPLLPVYIYYSMFGFQRVGDLIWAAADQRVRGFLLGATAGRTTLSGEGLQHQDGSSHLVAATVPNCRAWDPAFASELAVILDHAARRMIEESRDEFHYVTVMNENYAQHDLPDGVEGDLLRGLYRFGARGEGATSCVLSARARSCLRRSSQRTCSRTTASPRKSSARRAGRNWRAAHKPSSAATGSAALRQRRFRTSGGCCREARR